MSDQIKVGDLVQVNFNGAELTLCHEAVVLNVPCAGGDSWVFRSTSDGCLHYVSEGCTVSKKESRE